MNQMFIIGEKNAFYRLKFTFLNLKIVCLIDACWVLKAKITTKERLVAHLACLLQYTAAILSKKNGSVRYTQNRTQCSNNLLN